MIEDEDTTAAWEAGKRQYESALMSTVTVPPGLRRFAHLRLEPRLNVWEPRALEGALPLKHCVTRRGEPICTCKTYLLVWTEDRCEAGPP